MESNGYRSIWNTTSKSFPDEPIRIQSSLELLSYVADAQSPQPVAKPAIEEGKQSR